MKFFLVLCMLFTLPAFSQSFEAVLNEEGLRAYQKTLYLGLRAKCASCHGDGGMAIGHSVSDVTSAYAMSRELVDFANIENSRFVTKVRAQHWKRHDPTQNGMPEEEMVSLLNAWWTEGEFDVGQKRDFVSREVAIPANLPRMKEGRFTNMSWDMGASRADLAGCTATVDIQLAQEPVDSIPGAYRVKNPRISCTKQNIKLQSVYFSVSGELAKYENIYERVNMTVPRGAGETLMSSEIMILIQRKSSDTLSLLVNRLQLGQ